MRKNRVLQKTEALLRSDANLRDSDKKLLLAFWRREGLSLTPEQERAFMNVTPAESITRKRRELKKQYPASQVIEEERYRKSVENRNEYGQPVIIFPKPKQRAMF